MMARVNEDRCPVCKCQLDGAVYFYYADVYCCSGGEDEYKAHYEYSNREPVLSRTTVYTLNGNSAYEIHHQYLNQEEYRNTIYRLDLGLSGRWREANKLCALDYKGTKLFLDKNLDEEAITKKLKLYRVFS